MATYLCCNINNSVKSFTAKDVSEAGKSYLRVSNGYFPLTTETTTGVQLKFRSDNTNYRIVETYITSVSQSRTYVSTYTSSANKTTGKQTTVTCDKFTQYSYYYTYSGSARRSRRGGSGTRTYASYYTQYYYSTNTQASYKISDLSLLNSVLRTSSDTYSTLVNVSSDSMSIYNANNSLNYLMFIGSVTLTGDVGATTAASNITAYINVSYTSCYTYNHNNYTSSRSGYLRYEYYSTSISTYSYQTQRNATSTYLVSTTSQ